MLIYFQVLKRNMILVLMTFILLFLTVGYWYYMPLYGLTDYFFKTNVPGFIQLLLICISIGFCFSLYFVPFHLLFARTYSKERQKEMFTVFLLVQMALIITASVLFAGFYVIVAFLLI